MTLSSKQLLLAAALCLLASRHSHTQARPLEPADFVVAGIADNYPDLDVALDMASVRQTLGRPDTITRSEFQPGDMTTVWHYDGLFVAFGSISRIGITLTSPRYATRRGLRVGDTEQRVLALYGSPSRREDADWIYEDPRERLNVITVTVQDHRVERVYIGSVWD